MKTVERVRVVHPGEEKHPGRPYCGHSVVYEKEGERFYKDFKDSTKGYYNLKKQRFKT